MSSFEEYFSQNNSILSQNNIKQLTNIFVKSNINLIVLKNLDISKHLDLKYFYVICEDLKIIGPLRINLRKFLYDNIPKAIDNSLNGIQSELNNYITYKKKFQCEICKNFLGSKRNLKYHNYIHTKQWPETCHICNKGCRNKYQLNDHIKRKHNTLRSFICNFKNCGKSFKCINNLNNHKLAHLKNNINTNYQFVFNKNEKKNNQFILHKLKDNNIISNIYFIEFNDNKHINFDNRNLNNQINLR